MKSRCSTASWAWSVSDMVLLLWLAGSTNCSGIPPLPLAMRTIVNRAAECPLVSFGKPASIGRHATRARASQAARRPALGIPSEHGREARRPAPLEPTPASAADPRAASASRSRPRERVRAARARAPRQRRRPRADPLHRATRPRRRERPIGDRPALRRAARRGGRLRDPPPGAHVPARRAITARCDPTRPGGPQTEIPFPAFEIAVFDNRFPAFEAPHGAGRGGRLHRRPRRLLRHARRPSAPRR